MSSVDQGALMSTPVRSFRGSSGKVAIACAAVLGFGAAVAAASTASSVEAITAKAHRCASSGLVAWLDTQGNGAAGSSFFNLKFTNLSGHSCTLFGYPGVAAIDIPGHQLGSAASRNTHLTPHVVSLANGASATAVLRIVQAANFPPSICGLVTAAGLRVFPPNQTAAQRIPFPFSACSRNGPVYLTVEAVT